MVLVKNLQFFYSFNIGKIGQENVFENILARRKAFPDFKNKKLKNWKNWDFSKGSMVLVKEWHFFYLFNIGIVGQENVSKGLVHGFSKKLAIFLSF